MTRLAVLIPVYNDQEGLQATLESLRKVDGKFDVVVVDDGSNPEITVNSACYPFAIKLMKMKTNSGVAAALNFGLDFIFSQYYSYVARLDAWDTSEPERFRKQISFLDEHHSHGIVGCDVDFVDWDGRALYRYGPERDHESILAEMRYRPSFIHPAVMLRKQALVDVGRYRTNYPGSEDYDLFIRILRRYKGANLGEVLTHVYLNPLGITLTKRHELIRTRLRLQLENFCFASPHSYLGVVRTALLAITPYELLFAVKRLLRPA